VIRPSGNRESQLTSGHVLARNAIWNLIGNGAPLVFALVSIPVLIHSLGKDRFGVLALAWTVIGYASLFDLGLGRALTQLVAHKLALNEDEQLPSLVWTSLSLMLVLGGLGTVAVTLLAPVLVHRFLHVPTDLQEETVRAFYLLGLCVPLVVTTAGLRGLLEAHQEFGFVNGLRIPMGVYTFVGPLIVLPFSGSLVPIVATLVIGRFMALLGHIYFCMHIMPQLYETFHWSTSAAGPLLRFGGWMTISNIVSPVMVSMDRFLIGAVVSMAAVTYYATPFEVVAKFLFIPAALMAVMFPAFSTSFAKDQQRAAVLYGRCIKYLVMVLFPLTLLTICLARPALELWLGTEFARESFRVLQFLAIGVFFNGLANAPFTLLQGSGRPDLTAKLHLIELPLYLLSLWFMTLHWGIAGAAVAWTLRVLVDALVLALLCGHLVPTTIHTTRLFYTTAGIALVVFAGASYFSGFRWLGPSYLSVCLILFATATWLFALGSEERALLKYPLRFSRAAFDVE
jgi:O-antigen/teichoic acid export membrane protein